LLGPKANYTVSDYGAAYTKALIEANTRKGMIADLFRQVKEDHIRAASAVCGMTRPGDLRGTKLMILKQQDLGDSLRDDCSYDNLRRLAWVVYASTMKAYEKVFDIEMNEYYEIKFMEQKGIVYRRPVAKDGKEYTVKGCISRHINRMLNQMRCYMRDSMMLANSCVIGNVSSCPPQKELKESGIKNTPTVFWFGRKTASSEDLKTMSEYARKHQDVTWEHVSFIGRPMKSDT
jgi:hypothetical protein